MVHLFSILIAENKMYSAIIMQARPPSHHIANVYQEAESASYLSQLVTTRLYLPEKLVNKDTWLCACLCTGKARNL